MKPMMSLAWKEWHEVRIYLWIAIGIFIGLPLADGIEVYIQNSNRIIFSASPWVLGFGGVLAIFIAVGATCRDFTGHLEDFWRSRPLNVARWMLVKYFVGLAVVLAACVPPLAIELAINHDKSAAPIIIWFPFFWAALYSIGFLAGCLLRRTAQAAMLALTGMLLLYLLPVVLPPLQWLNISNVTAFYVLPGEWPIVFGLRQFVLAAGMTGLAVAVLLFALLAVRRDWRINAGRKMMYGSVSAAVLILVTSAAFQLGTNMPILREVNLPMGESVSWIRYSDSNSYVMTMQKELVNRHETYHFNFRTLKVTDSNIELGTPIRIDHAFRNGVGSFQESVPGDPKIVYYIEDISIGDPDVNAQDIYSLHVAQLDTQLDKPLLQIAEEDSHHHFWRFLYASHNRLYVISTPNLITLDISRPLEPRVISSVPFSYSLGRVNLGDEKVTIILPTVPDLSARERLEAVIRTYGYLEGDVFCCTPFTNGKSDITLCAYQLTQLTDAKAVFERNAEYKPTFLENMFGSPRSYNGMLQNSLFFLVQGTSGQTNPHIDVLNTDGPRPLRVIGHFAAPGVRTMFPLPDGTTLVGGDKIWLVGPPPRRGAE